MECGLPGEAVAPRHREVLELGEIGVRVRIDLQLEEVEIDVVVGHRLERLGVGVGPAVVGGLERQARHRPIVNPTQLGVNRPPALADAARGCSADEREDGLAVAFRLHRPDAGHVEERPHGAGPGTGDAGEGGVGEDDVRGRAGGARLRSRQSTSAA